MPMFVVEQGKRAEAPAVAANGSAGSVRKAWFFSRLGLELCEEKAENE